MVTFGHGDGEAIGMNLQQIGYKLVLGGDDLYGVIWLFMSIICIYIYIYPKQICFEHHRLNFVPGRGDGTVPRAFYLIYMYQRWYIWISWEDGNKQL